MSDEVSRCEGCGGLGGVPSVDPNNGQPITLPCPACNGSGWS